MRPRIRSAKGLRPWPVSQQHVLRRTVGFDASALDPETSLATLKNGVGVVRHEEERRARCLELAQALQAVLPKRRIPDGQHLVQDEDVGHASMPDE
jgi:hypothetical protein